MVPLRASRPGRKTHGSTADDSRVRDVLDRRANPWDWPSKRVSIDPMAEGGKNPPGKPGASAASTLASPGVRNSGKMPAAPASVRPPPATTKSGSMRAAPIAKPSRGKEPVAAEKKPPEEAERTPTPGDVKPLPPPPADLGASLGGSLDTAIEREIGARLLGTPLEEGSGRMRAVAISIPPDPNAPPKIRETHGSIRPEGAESLVGAVVGGRYKIDKLLGEGAMGAVFLAEHRLMRKKVALKVLHPQWSSVSDIVARFEREAMAASRIEHPNVAAATDFGQLEDGAFFLVLEFVEGRTLRQEIALGAFTVPRALHVLRQIASALVKAHGLGIVHRDLKPENVMLLERAGQADFVKVLDFGIAKITEGDLERMSGPKTEVGMVYGTPEYMAPEQALGQNIDGRADLYAVGVIAFELLTGHRPFHAENKLALLGMHVHADLPAMSDRNPNVVVPPMVERFVAKLLAKKPDARFPDAKALLAALDELAEELVQVGIFAEEELRNIGSMRELRSPRAVDLASGRAFENESFAQTEVVPSDAVVLTEPMPMEARRQLEAGAEEVIELEPRKKRIRAPVIAGIASAIGAVVTVGLLQLARTSPATTADAGAPVAALPRSTFLAERTLPAPPSPTEATPHAAPHAAPDHLMPTARPAVDPAPAPVPPPPAPPVPPAARGLDPESAVRKAQEFVNAGQAPRAIALLEETLAANPKHPGLSLALFKAQLGGSSRASSLAAANRWLESDTSAVAGAAPQIMALVDDALAANDGVDEAFKLLGERLGWRGADKLYELAYGPGAQARTQLAARARTSLQFASALTKATPGLKIALQLRAAQGCEEVAALLRRAREVGDERSANQLRPYTKTDGCKGGDCYPCMRGTADLANAISAAEKRPVAP
jgi:serine/threonine protein kinase